MENTLGPLWARKLRADDPDFRTFAYEIESVPVLLIVHLPTMRFRVFVDSQSSFKHDITPLMRREMLETLMSYANTDLGLGIGGELWT